MSKRYLFMFIQFLIFFHTYAQVKKKVYISFKTGYSLSYYYAYHHIFFKQLFGPYYDVIAVETLKNLPDPFFIITDEVPKDDKEIAYLSSYPIEKRLLFTFEPPLDQVRSNDKKYHELYCKVFTWNDDLIDNKKYFKVRFPWMDPRPMGKVPHFNQRNLCVFVGNNVLGYEDRPCSNYNARRELFDYLIKKNAKVFDLYGNGWPQSKSYKGSIPTGKDRRMNKINTIKNYKFDICYENCKNLNGWLSERIFESFAAGCIPIYWGAPNINRYIPSNCFIDRKKFKNNDELYFFMKNIKESTYNTYIRNIKKYLASEAAFRVSTYSYIQNIRTILHISENQ